MRFNALIPELTVMDPARSLRFYVQTLGFQVEYDRPETGFTFLSFQGAQLMISRRNGAWETGSLEYPLGRGINFEIGVADIDPLLAALSAGGYPLMLAPFDSWYRTAVGEKGQREFLVTDPDGYLLRFAQALEGRSPFSE